MESAQKSDGAAGDAPDGRSRQVRAYTGPPNSIRLSSMPMRSVPFVEACMIQLLSFCSKTRFERRRTMSDSRSATVLRPSRPVVRLASSNVSVRGRLPRLGLKLK